jgi:hypothetical protein
VTVDKGIQYQQNLSDLEIAVILLRAPTNDISDLEPLVPKVLQVLPTAAVEVCCAVVVLIEKSASITAWELAHVGPFEIDVRFVRESRPLRPRLGVNAADYA